MTIFNDQQLIDEILEGNSNAFSIIVDRYKDLVFTITLKMINDFHEAEEVTQDSFIKAYKNLAKFKNESKFSTWLYRITYNNCLDHIKKTKKKSFINTTEQIEEVEFSEINNGLKILEEKERKNMINFCIKKLEAEDYFLLTLFYFEENNLNEIAKIIGTNTNHVKIKLYRARKKLSTILKFHLEPEIIKYYEN